MLKFLCDSQGTVRRAILYVDRSCYELKAYKFQDVKVGELLICLFIQDYEIRIKNLQEEVERHSMMSSIITVSDLTSELELVQGNY